MGSHKEKEEKMSYNPSNILASFPDESSRAGPFSGAYQTLGSVLSDPPIMIIFDNQSDVSVEVSVNGSSTWKTFVAGEALVLDMRANKGHAHSFSLPVGTQIYVKGTAGTGSFRMSLVVG